MAEHVFIRTDPAFNVVLEFLSRTVSIDTIAIAQEAELDTVQNSVTTTTWRDDYQFSRTASVCFRMAWLKACGIDEKFWPRINEDVKQNNAPRVDFKLSHGDEKFQLANDKIDTGNYYAYFDQLYHYNRIRANLHINRNNMYMPSMMVIVRQQEIIVINITVHVQRIGNQFTARTQSYVVVHRLKDPTEVRSQIVEWSQAKEKHNEECEKLIKELAKISITKKDGVTA